FRFQTGDSLPLRSRLAVELLYPSNCSLFGGPFFARMTRHSPSEAAVGNEIPVPGLHANFTLLTAFNDAVGKEVLLELIDGSVFSGIFGGASSDMEIGLYCAYEKTAENERNLLPLKNDIVQKRQFAFSDIVCVTVPTNDEKMIRGFATDRDYHSKRKAFDDESELEAWEGDGEDVDLEHDEPKVASSQKSRNGGWGVNEMFAANSSLGVKTTFEDNLSQYTTAEVEGTAEDRKRAEEIARQIEKSGSSRMYSALENDDEERDLDKITEEAELLGNEMRNKNAWSNGSSSITNNNTKGLNGSSMGESHQSLSSPRPLPLMTAPPGFTPVLHNGRKKTTPPSHNDSYPITSLPLAANRPMNNNGRGGSNQTAPKNNRAEGLKGDMRRSSGGPMGGGAPPPRNAPMASPKGGQQQGYAKRDQYEGQGGGYDNWSNAKSSGGVKTYESNKFRDQQNKMMLENRNASNSPRGPTAGTPAGGAPPSGPSTPQGGKGGATSRVEGLKAWQHDFNPSYRETRPPQKGGATNEKSESVPQSSPVAESVPPPKNAWQSGPPSGLTAASKSEEKNVVPSQSTVAPTPAEAKALEEREMGESVNASTSHEENEKAADVTRNTDDPDMSKESSGSKKFSFNPDAPAFTPKLPSGGGMGGGPPMGGVGPQSAQPPLMMQPVVPLVPALMPGQPMNMQGQMGGMGGMQQPTMHSFYTQPHYPNMQPNMQFSAVVNGGGIMAGSGNGAGQGGQGPSTPRGTNGQGGVGVGPRQTPRMNGGGGGGTPATMAGGAMYVQSPFQASPMPQATYMATPQGSYYYNPVQQQMIGYQMPMGMQQQGMMSQAQRGYVPTQPPHQGMMMHYGGQYGPGVAPQQQQMQMQGGGVSQMGGTTQGGPTPSASSTNGSTGAGGAQSSQSMQANQGGGGGGVQNGIAHPPSQPPTPGAVQQGQGGGGGMGGGPPQGGGAMPPPVPSPNMYYPGQQVMYYGQGGPQMGQMGAGGGGGGHEGHEGGAGGEGGGLHPMHYQYNNGQYFQNAPPHLVRGYQMAPHGMPQQQMQHQPVQPSQSQN
ncbi:hypothetical protein PFISCL1PPCAC_10628, partial [Pristionchus fissidentatus]